jgi:5-methyltetrahydrofolate--homocysteine methyltransferase
MDSQDLKDLIRSRNALLVDGATGSNYFHMGLSSGDPPELWNIQHKERVLALHRDFILSGADVIWTNSFGANSERLKLHNLKHKVRELNQRAVSLAQEAIATSQSHASHPVLVAASVGPTGSLIEPNGPLSLSDAIACFEEQIQALKEAGADFIAFETLSSFEETHAALQAAASNSMPCILTLSFDSPRNHTMMGISPDSLIDFIHDQTYQPFAIGANCGVGPHENLHTLLGIKKALSRLSLHDQILLIGKPNRGIPLYKDGKISYSGDDNDLSHYTKLAYQLGVSLIGGCCGTTPQNLAIMRNALDACISSPPHPSPPSPEDFDAHFGSPHEPSKPHRTHRSRRKTP